MRTCRTCKHCEINQRPKRKWWQWYKKADDAIRSTNAFLICLNPEVAAVIDHNLMYCSIERRKKYDSITACGSTGKLHEPAIFQ